MLQAPQHLNSRNQHRPYHHTVLHHGRIYQKQVQSELCYLSLYMRLITPKRLRRRQVRKSVSQAGQVPCIACSATGRDWVQVNKPCLRCHGRGWVVELSGIDCHLAFAA